MRCTPMDINRWTMKYILAKKACIPLDALTCVLKCVIRHACPPVLTNGIWPITTSQDNIFKHWCAMIKHPKRCAVTLSSQSGTTLKKRIHLSSFFQRSTVIFLLTFLTRRVRLERCATAPAHWHVHQINAKVVKTQ
eukprot:UN26453